MLIISEGWREMYPGAVVGALALRDVRNPEALRRD